MASLGQLTPGGSIWGPQGRDLNKEAPPGYVREPNTGRLIPQAGSATDVLSQRARQQQIEDEARSRNYIWASEDRQARNAMRERLTGMLDRPLETASSSGGGFGAMGYGAGSGGGPNVAPITMPDISNAQANIFARAKDKVGQETAGSLASLRSALAGRGMLGGGAEVRGTQNILQAGQAQLGDTTREQAIQEGDRLSDFAKTAYGGAITQRGQDITARGQDLQASIAAADRAQNANRTRYDSVMGLLSKLY